MPRHPKSGIDYIRGCLPKHEIETSAKTAAKSGKSYQEFNEICATAIHAPMRSGENADKTYKTILNITDTILKEYNIPDIFEKETATNMDVLQAWIILATHYRMPRYLMSFNPTDAEYLILQAFNTVDEHIDSTMTGEDDTDIIQTASECQSHEWNEHLNKMLKEVGHVLNVKITDKQKLHITAYHGNESEISELSDEPLMDIISEAYHMDSNSEHPYFPDTISNILKQLWEQIK